MSYIMNLGMRPFEEHTKTQTFFVALWIMKGLTVGKDTKGAKCCETHHSEKTGFFVHSIA